MTSAEVVVVGGGIIGASITYYLAKAGVDVMLVERGDLASGTSGACGGSITVQTKGAPVSLSCALQSQTLYRALSDELGEDLEYEESGSMVIAETEEEVRYLAGQVAARRTGGLAIELLDGDAARQRQAALGESVLAASVCETDGEVNPLRVVFAFAEAAKRRGAKIRTYTEVRGMVVEEGRVAAVVTDRGRVLTGMVVNAGGVWAPALGRMVGVSVPIRPRRGLLVVTEGVPFRLRGTVIAAKYLMSKFGKETAIGTRAEDSSVSVGLVVAQAKSGNLIFGSSREFAGYDTRTTAASLGRVVEDALRTLPVLRRVRAIRAFAGLRPASADGLPIVGRAPGVEGFVIAGGHEGDGVALAPITGRLIADLVLGGEVAQELNALRYDRFS